MRSKIQVFEHLRQFSLQREGLTTLTGKAQSKATKAEMKGRMPRAAPDRCDSALIKNPPGMDLILNYKHTKTDDKINVSTLIKEEKSKLNQSGMRELIQ